MLATRYLYVDYGAKRMIISLPYHITLELMPMRTLQDAEENVYEQQRQWEEDLLWWLSDAAGSDWRGSRRRTTNPDLGFCCVTAASESGDRRWTSDGKEDPTMARKPSRSAGKEMGTFETLDLNRSRCRQRKGKQTPNQGSAAGEAMPLSCRW